MTLIVQSRFRDEEKSNLFLLHEYQNSPLDTLYSLLNIQCAIQVFLFPKDYPKQVQHLRISILQSLVGYFLPHRLQFLPLILIHQSSFLIIFHIQEILILQNRLRSLRHMQSVFQLIFQ